MENVWDGVEKTPVLETLFNRVTGLQAIIT